MIEEGVIIDSNIAYEILNAGFLVLGEHSPFVRYKESDIIYHRHLNTSKDWSIISVYILSENQNYITKNLNDKYVIDMVHAEPYAQVTSFKGYLHIDSGLRKFNHLLAIQKYQEILNNSSSSPSEHQ